MASLRARLVVAVLALALIGMLLLGGITYAEQRSFLINRVDEQARAAPGPIEGALADRGIGESVPSERSGRHGDGPLRGGGPGVGLPTGTYGERRDASGKVLGAVVLNYGRQDVTAHPSIPAQVPLGRAFTVSANAGDANRYRVYAQRDRFSGATTVVAVPLREVEQTLNRLLLVELLVIAGVLLMLGVIAWVVVRIGLLPLDRIGHTAGAIAGGDLSHRVAATDPRTEVGRLGASLNAMLDRLERAFAERQASEDRLRRFLADASHELRTPLTSIRGYAELFRIGATRSPQDTAKSMRRIEEEAARMGVLVEDLLTLARLDQVPDADHAEVDLGHLVEDAVDDARATAPDRKIDVDVAGPANVRGDAHQLRQLLGNLVRNALVHTPAGTPIEVRLDPGADELRLEVRDHGPGLPAAGAATLFERFWRAEGGRERGRGGAGLGLAIVAAIVDAHGGRVDAANAPDGGASFVVHLPRMATPAQ